MQNVYEISGEKDAPRLLLWWWEKVHNVDEFDGVQCIHPNSNITAVCKKLCDFTN